MNKYDFFPKQWDIIESVPKRWNKQGRWPGCFDQLWKAIECKVGASEAARQMVDVLMLCREHDLAVVELAVRGALAAGAHDGRAVKLLADRRARPEPEADR